MDVSPLDPGSLIESREALREAAFRWLREPRPLLDGDDRLAEIALVSAEPVLWEPYACAFGFSAETGEEPLAVLDLPFEPLLAEPEAAAELPWIRYSAQFATLPLRDFAGGAYALARHFRRASFANSVPSLVCMEWCARHAKDVEQCIRDHCLA